MQQINPTTLDDWEQLRPLIEDGELRFSAGDPDLLVLKFRNTTLQIEWSFTWVIDDVVDTIETFGHMDEALSLARHLERQAQRIRQTLKMMEA